jgi:DNA-binding MarR family transcriptional regulator
MKTVVRKSVKLDVPLVARFVAERNGMASPALLVEIQAAFRCGRRAAQDALTILVRGGWLDRRSSPHDQRRKHYFVTDKGWEDLPTWSGERDMRLARWEHSTTSTRARYRPSCPTNPMIWHAMMALLERGVPLLR